MRARTGTPSPVPRPLSPAGGFTLVEATIAALLLAVGVLALLGAERNARLLGERGAGRLRSVEAAASALDSARAGCGSGVPLAEGAIAVSVPVATAPAERAVHVETLVACGTPP